jgi:rsbT co-antagonist protein RsbR
VWGDPTRTATEEARMADQFEQRESVALMHQMGLNGAAIERRKQIAGLTPADIARIATIKDVVSSQIEDYAAAFFDHLASLDEARPLLENRALADKARQLKMQHLRGLVSGDYGAAYVEQRLELGLLYAAAGLDTRVFLGAFLNLLRHIGSQVMRHAVQSPIDAFEAFMSLNKVAYFDLGLIVDVLVFERERVIRQQQEAIRELSTPVLQLRERLLLLPIIGVIDTYRARLITESLLEAIRANRAKVVVMDITGVATIDSRVANHILQTVTAARLMGAKVIVTGISAPVAQSLVSLGIELGRLDTVGDLQGGIELAERNLGYRVMAGQDEPIDSRMAGGL